MNQAPLMDVGEGATQIDEHFFHPRPSLGQVVARQSADFLVQIRPFDALHGDVGMPVNVAVALDPNHVGVLEASQRPKLPTKSRQTGAKAVGLENLEGHIEPPGIAPQNDVGHAAAPQGPLVSVGPNGVAGTQRNASHHDL